jgi:hypothetical protein
MVWDEEYIVNTAQVAHMKNEALIHAVLNAEFDDIERGC